MLCAVKVKSILQLFISSSLSITLLLEDFKSSYHSLLANRFIDFGRLVVRPPLNDSIAAPIGDSFVNNSQCALSIPCAISDKNNSENK